MAGTVLVLSAFAVSLAAACGPGLGQDVPAPNDEHLKCYDQLIGDWVYDGPVLEDSQWAEKGARIIMHRSWKRVLNNNAIEHAWSNELEGAGKISGITLIVWNSIETSIVGSGVDSFTSRTPNRSTATFDPEAKALVTKAIFVANNGKENETTFVRTLAGHTEYVMQHINRADGSDSPKYIFKRAKQAEAPHENLKTWADVFTGDWTGESIVDEDGGPLKKGDKINASWSTKWSPDKEALYASYSAKANAVKFVTVKAVMGWDASEEAVVTRWFSSMGGSGEIVYKKDGPNWTAKWTRVNADKTRDTWTDRIKILDPNTHDITQTDRVVDGQKKPDLKRTAKRK